MVGRLLIALLAVLVAPSSAGAAIVNGDLLFTSAGQIHRSAADGSELRKLTNEPRTAAQGSWSPDGSRIAYRVGTPGSSDVLRIALIDQNGGGRVVLEGGDSGFHETQPAFSPDGQWIVYRRAAVGAQYSGDVWRMRLDGSVRQPLVPGEDDVRYPTLSPDGTKLLYSRGASSGRYEIVVHPLGGGSRPLTYRDAYRSAPSWSPDGARIAFERRPTIAAADEPQTDLFTISASGGDERPLPSSAALDEGPAYAPEGDRIVFATTRDGNQEIYTMGADGSDVRRVTNLPTIEESPAWQPVQVTACPMSGCPPAPESRPPADTDRDGFPDASDNCPTIASGDRTDSDRDSAGDVCDADDDNDGLSDAREARLRTSRIDLDSDDDGLSDRWEVRRRLRGARRDSDRDGVTDGVETGVRRPVADPAGRVRGTNRARFRRDRDPRTRTNPLRRDTDRDGRSDGREDRNRNGRRDRGETDPRRRASR